jgi:hypothetical protein
MEANTYDQMFTQAWNEGLAQGMISKRLLSTESNARIVGDAFGKFVNENGGRAAERL